MGDEQENGPIWPDAASRRTPAADESTQDRGTGRHAAEPGRSSRSGGMFGIDPLGSGHRSAKDAEADPSRASRSRPSAARSALSRPGPLLGASSRPSKPPKADQEPFQPTASLGLSSFARRSAPLPSQAPDELDRDDPLSAPRETVLPTRGISRPMSAPPARPVSAPPARPRSAPPAKPRSAPPASPRSAPPANARTVPPANTRRALPTRRSLPSRPPGSTPRPASAAPATPPATSQAASQAAPRSAPPAAPRSAPPAKPRSAPPASSPPAGEQAAGNDRWFTPTVEPESGGPSRRSPGIGKMFLRSPGSVPQPERSSEPFVPTAPLDGLMARRPGRTHDDKDGDNRTTRPSVKPTPSADEPRTRRSPSPRHRPGRHSSEQAASRTSPPDWSALDDSRTGRSAGSSPAPPLAPQQRPPRPTPRPTLRRQDTDRSASRGPRSVASTPVSPPAPPGIGPSTQPTGQDGSETLPGSPAAAAGTAQQPPLSVPPVSPGSAPAMGQPAGRMGKVVRSIESVPFDRVKRMVLLGVAVGVGAVLMLAAILIVTGVG